MNHPYVSKFHDPANEPVLDKAVAIPIDDNTKFSIADYRDKLYGEVVRKRGEARRSRKSGARLDNAEKTRQRRASAGGNAAAGGRRG
jgi:mitogen-activated protein kinase 15